MRHSKRLCCWSSLFGRNRNCVRLVTGETFCFSSVRLACTKHSVPSSRRKRSQETAPFSCTAESCGSCRKETVPVWAASDGIRNTNAARTAAEHHNHLYLFFFLCPPNGLCIRNRICKCFHCRKISGFHLGTNRHHRLHNCNIFHGL